MLSTHLTVSRIHFHKGCTHFSPQVIAISWRMRAYIFLEHLYLFLTFLTYFWHLRLCTHPHIHSTTTLTQIPLSPPPPSFPGVAQLLHLFSQRLLMDFSRLIGLYPIPELKDIDRQTDTDTHILSYTIQPPNKSNPLINSELLLTIGSCMWILSYWL